MAHTRWVAAVTHEKTPCVEENPEKCVFGKWLQEQKDVLDQLPEFQALDIPHRALHEAYTALKSDSSLEDLHNNVRTLSHQLIDHIDALEKRLNKLKVD